jgi:hypothetical protein
MRIFSPRSDKTFVMDYTAALTSAVAWLGNRYLLASPVKKLTHLESSNTNLTPAPSVPRRSRSDN